MDAQVPDGLEEGGSPAGAGNTTIWEYDDYYGQKILRKKGGSSFQFVSVAAINNTSPSLIDFSEAHDPAEAKAEYDRLRAHEQKPAAAAGGGGGGSLADSLDSDSGAPVVPEQIMDQVLKSALVFSCSHAWDAKPGNTRTSLLPDGTIDVTVIDKSGISKAWNPILKEALEASKKDPNFASFYADVLAAQGKTDSLEKAMCVAFRRMKKNNTFPSYGPFMSAAQALKDYGHCADDISALFNPTDANGECIAVVVKSPDGNEVLVCMLVKAINCPKHKVYVSCYLYTTPSFPILPKLADTAGTIVQTMPSSVAQTTLLHTVV